MTITANPETPLPEEVPAPPRSRHLDVLRGFAILIVLLHHTPQEIHRFVHLSFGGRGVDMFFVLSGFLVGTTALRRQFEGKTRLRALTEFVVLRVTRTWPLYYALLAIAAIGFSWYDPVATNHVRSHPAEYIFFFTNYLPREGLTFGVLWSLAVEEHFYLLVGLVVAFGATNREALRRAFLGAAIVMIAVALVYRRELVVANEWGVIPGDFLNSRIFFATLSRFDAMAVGLAIAALTYGGGALRPFAIPAWLGRVAIWPITLGVTLLLARIPSGGVSSFTLVAIACGAAIVLALKLPSGLLPRGISILVTPVERIFTLAGELSFGLYLFHPLTMRWLWNASPSRWAESRTGAFTFFFVWLVATYAAAWFSHRFFEMPLLERARRWVNRERSSSISRSSP